MATRLLTHSTTTLAPEWWGTVLIHHTEMTREAHRVAAHAHMGTRRTFGDVFLDHPLRVAQMLQVSGFNEEVVSAAILHDVVEDSEVTLADLTALFSEAVVTAVDACTKRAGEDYQSLVLRAAAHPVGRLVKLADNMDNSSPAQLAPLSPAKRERVTVKYANARSILIKALGNM